ncbi:MAG: AAA family ATPase, partial [Clostridia bacterium]|nr:AAA family ATPase [Clostridia bacterium]
MGKYFNPGNEKFREHRQQEIYVDKSGMIVWANKCFRNNLRQLCVDRPHRFGKTYDADMMVAYYSRGCDSEPLFRDLEIARDADFKKNLNKCDVVYFDVSDFIRGYGEDVRVTKIIKDLEADIIKEMIAEYPDELDDDFDGDGDLHVYLNCLFHKTKRHVVFVIDNFDAFYRERDSDDDGRTFNYFLNCTLKDNAYVGLTYMTGVLSIKQYPLSTAMDMFRETYMTRADFWKEYMGFTEKQVKELCEKYDKNYDNIRKWYGGYVVEDVPLFNPDSVVKAMLSPSQDFVDYWTDV